MKKILLLSALLAVLSVQAQLRYPRPRKSEAVDDYHGTKVEDPYRWLEDDRSEATKKWVQEENAVTFDYLGQIPFRQKVKQRLEELWNYPRYSNPFSKAGYSYFFRNNGLQNQSVLYRRKGLEGETEVVLDPNELSDRGIAALGGIHFSRSGKYMAYSVANAGSDWQVIYVMEAAGKRRLSDKIEWTKFSNVAWRGEEGFYYSAYDRPDEQNKLKEQNQFQKIYFHKLGTRQSEDQLIYYDKKHPLRYHSVALTEDERFLILYVSEGTSGAEIWFRDLRDPAQKNFKLLIPGFKTQPSVIDESAGKLLVQTNDGAPNYRVVLVDPKNPARANWKTILPEKKEALQDVTTAGGQLFASYLKDASTRVYQHDYSGSLVREIVLPGIGTASGFSGDSRDSTLFYTFASYSQPPSIYRYRIINGETTLFRKTEVKINTNNFVTEQTFYTSKDGTQIPVFITHRTDMQRNGDNPLLLYAYGGFNLPVTPWFSVSNAFFVEQGGIYAVANIRGGSEYGEQWHRAGMLEKKQNVFDDFIAVAESLIARGYTSNSKLAIRGESNGGLLVGAVMTQRPDLCKVALPLVGVMDMLRFHKFTVGWGWTVEYGNADSAKQFDFLYRYSPYHNLSPNTRYPATLIATADHDDRVVPAHSFKFAARLQEFQSGDNPVLIRIETDAGHGGGKPTSKQIDEAADIWSFVMQNLGMRFNEMASEQKARVESPLQRAMETRRTGGGAKPVKTKNP